MTEAPSPVADDLEKDGDLEDDTEDNGLYGWKDEAEGRWYQTDKHGNFEQDAQGNWVTLDDVVPEDELAEGDEVVGYLEEIGDGWADAA